MAKSLKKPLVTEKAIEIGKRINEMRERRNLTHQQLADLIGVTADGVKKIVSGESAVAYARIGEVARALGSTPNELIGYGGVSRERLTGALLALTRSAGYSEFQASELTKIVLQVLEAPQSQIPGVDEQTAAQIQTEVLFRQLLAAKPS
jgi:transcriptional regulator with XRE-family HTH domain